MPISFRYALAFWALAAAPPVWAADEIHWTITGPTSVTLDWRGDDSSLRYGRSAGYGLHATGVEPSPPPFSSSGPFYEARLTGLVPGATYHYSIAGGADHVFHTPPPSEARFIVYVEADVGDAISYPRVGSIQSLIADGRPDLVLVPGDLTYADMHGQSAVDQHFNDVMVWSQDAPYMPAWGNHEWDSSGDDLRNYKGRFDLPHPQTSPGAPSAGGLGEDWSWFDYGNVRFIAYPEPYSGAWADWYPRAKILMDQAQADPAIHFIVTYGHRPAYSSGHHLGEPTLASYLDALGDAHSKYVLNLNGHSHDYERTKPQHGVTHVTVGIGGSALEEESGSCLYDGGCPPPSWSAFRAFHHGALRLTVSEGSITGEALCGPAGDSDANRNDIACAPGDAFDAFVIGTQIAQPPLPRSTLALETASPNPARGAISITYALQSADPVHFEMADVSGRIVAQRDLGAPGPGSYTYLVDPALAPTAGMYWIRLSQAGFTRATKVIILR
ncbi:MAG TPA: metallophosphoesterase [Candidatus Eisenbacteria bacterium]|nr:metallophosphoesterase [Candidatus Eisenbacteria bacterium]